MFFHRHRQIYFVLTYSLWHSFCFTSRKQKWLHYFVTMHSAKKTQWQLQNVFVSASSIPLYFITWGHWTSTIEREDFFAVSFFIVIYFLFSSSNEFSDKKQIQILVDGNDMDKFSIVAIHVESKNIWNLLLFIWNCFLNNKMSRFFVCWKFIHVYICNTDYSTINVTESKQRLKRC